MTTTDLELDVPRDPSASAIVRQALRERLGDDLRQQPLEDLMLVTTELVNNAIVHGQGPIRLRIRYDGHVIRGEVIDDGGGFERQVRRRGVDEVGGRGLAIVDQIVTDWGIHEGTTHVWFEVNTHVWFEVPVDEPGAAGEGPHEPRLGADQRPPELG